MKRILIVAVCACAVPAHAKDKIDPRMGTIRTVWIEPVDALGDDTPVSTCLTEHLTHITPLTLAPTKADADVTLMVKATIRTLNTAGDGFKLYFTRHNGTITAVAADRELWSGHVVTGRLRSNVACVLADQMLNALRKSMRTARDKR